ncbi:MAG: GNAT family N-acetyltransferase [Lagierella massiliensis]|nr:GNAT family N-acetyltransferase [Lagierella massiliensis]
MVEIVFEFENKRSAAYEGDKLVGECTFSNANGVMIINYTGVEPEYRGKGIAKKLVFEIVKAAREKDMKIIPLCPYAKKEFEKNKEYEDVLKK